MQLTILHEKILYLDSGIFSILKIGVISKKLLAQRVKISQFSVKSGGGRCCHSFRICASDQLFHMLVQ